MHQRPVVGPAHCCIPSLLHTTNKLEHETTEHGEGRGIAGRGHVNTGGAWHCGQGSCEHGEGRGIAGRGHVNTGRGVALQAGVM